MTKRAESNGLGARAELRAWYLGHLRPRLVEAATASIVMPGAIEELDLQLAEPFELPERRNLDPERHRGQAGRVRDVCRV